MKTKSKLLLVLSALTVGTVAAGATGTYAWFTASRTASISTTVTATNTRGNLAIGYYGFDSQDTIATDSPADESSQASFTVDSNFTLSDVSSKEGATFYSAVIGPDGSPTSYRAATGGYLQFVVELKNLNTAGAVEAYLDKDAIELTKSDESAAYLSTWTRVAISASGNSNPNTGAFTNSDLTQNGHLVFMNNNGGTSGETLNKFVTKAGAATEGEILGTYTGDENFYPQFGSIPAVPATVNTEVECYLGQIAAGGSIYVSVAVWMEGTVKNDQNSADGNSIDLKLGFSALEAAE